MSGVLLARPRERADIVTVCEGKAPVLGRNGVVATLHRDQLKNPNGGKGVDRHHFTMYFVHLRSPRGRRERRVACPAEREI